MVTDARPGQHQGNLPWHTLLALINAYDTPDHQWQGYVQGPDGFGLKITRGAHPGAFYGAYKTDYYFDFRTVDARGESKHDYHALLDAGGTKIIGIEPAL